MSEYLGNTLKIMRQQKGLSQKSVCEKLGVKQSTFSSWENGVHEPSASMLLEICKLYDMGDVVTLFFGGMTEEGNFILNDNEINLLENLRLLPLELSEPIVEFINELAKYFKNSPKKPYEASQEVYEKPMYYLAASAGKGQFLDSDNFEMKEFPKSILPDETTFAVRVSGDSMEPDYPNNSIVFVKRTKTLEPGDIGIFVLNDEGYIKELGTNQNLISKNKDYSDIVIKEFDDLRIVGKVIGEPYLEE